MRGGYKLIDLKNVVLDDITPVVIPGIYESIESTFKPIILENVNFNDSVFYPAAEVTFYALESVFYANLSIANSDDTAIILTISVNDDDEVLITTIEVAPPEEEGETV